jgi:hypothetical protein
MSIQFLKLTNGETILADVLGKTDRYVTLLNPIEVSIKGVSTAQKASMIGYQWLPLLDDENIIEVSSMHVIALSEASIEVKEFYVDVVDQYLYPEKYEAHEQETLDKYSEMLRQIQSMANTVNKSVH